MKKIILAILVFCCFHTLLQAQKYVESYNKGTEKAQEGDFKGALKEFDKALKDKPDYMEALYNRATVKIQLQDYQGAIADLDQVLKIKPGFPGGLLNRAAAKGYMKDYAGGQADLDALLEAKPNYARAYTMRGQMKKNLKDREGACADFAKAQELGDKTSEKYTNLLCTGKFAIGKIVPKKETFTMEWPDSSDWKGADTERNANIEIIKYTKGKESLKSWTELGTVTTNRNITNVPLETAMKQAYAAAQLICPQARLTQLDKSEDDEFPWICFVIECPAGQGSKLPQSGVYQIVQGNANQYIISVAMKSAAIDEDTREAWKDLLSKGKVEYK